MTLYMKQKRILIKIEGTYGTDSTPAGAANAILMQGATLTPMEGEDVSRELDYAHLGAQPMIPAGLRGRLRGRVELAGSGTAGTAPAWGPLLRACACAETINAGTSVVYNPVSENHESVTIYFQLSATLHKLLGCRGTAQIKVSAQGIPHIEFDLMGLWVQPAEAAKPTLDLSAFQKPEIATSTNTPTFSINAVDMVLREADLNLGNDVQYRGLVGKEEILIPDRADAFTARVEAVPVTTFNPYQLANEQTDVAVSLVHGTQAGEIATLAIPKAQVKRLSGYEEAQNIAEWPLELTPLPNAGNDQWTLTLT